MSTRKSHDGNASVRLRRSETAQPRRVTGPPARTASAVPLHSRPIVRDTRCKRSHMCRYIPILDRRRTESRHQENLLIYQTSYCQKLTFIRIVDSYDSFISLS